MFGLRNLSVTNLRNAAVLAAAFEVFRLDTELLHTLSGIPNRANDIFLLFPARPEFVTLFLEFGDLFINPLGLALCAVPLDGFPFDFQLPDLPFHLIEILRHGVNLDPKPGRRFIDQVNGLVGQETIRDVPVTEFGRRYDGGVLDPHAVMHLVAVLDAAQDGNGIGYGRLCDQHHLKTAFQRLVFFEVLAILVEGGCADGAQFAAGESGFQNVRRIHCAFRSARAHERMDFVDEQNDLSIRFGDFPDDSFQPVLEFAAVFGARDERAHIERDQPLVLEPFRYIALHDANGQTFRNRRFPDPGFPDQHRIVFGPAGKNLQDAPDFFVAPDNGVDAALPCQLDEITGKALERLMPIAFLLGIHSDTRFPPTNACFDANRALYPERIPLMGHSRIVVRSVPTKSVPEAHYMTVWQNAKSADRVCMFSNRLVGKAVWKQRASKNEKMADLMPILHFAGEKTGRPCIKSQRKPGDFLKNWTKRAHRKRTEGRP